MRRCSYQFTVLAISSRLKLHIFVPNVLGNFCQIDTTQKSKLKHVAYYVYNKDLVVFVICYSPLDGLEAWRLENGR